MPACPRRWLAVSLTACSAVVAGCGTSATPALERADGAALIALAHRIAGEGACAQARDIPRLRTQAIALVNAGKVPSELQEPLMSAVAALAAQQPLCLPTVRTTKSPPPATKAKRHGEHGHHGRKHEKDD
ncbi:MAG TPA: hypothetical protein VNR59_01185 [Gaiellaceae bacterium]|nr:hypothetical protein [Gaiellaceae bacterium]